MAPEQLRDWLKSLKIDSPPGLRELSRLSDRLNAQPGLREAFRKLSESPLHGHLRRLRLPELPDTSSPFPAGTIAVSAWRPGAGVGRAVLRS